MSDFVNEEDTIDDDDDDEILFTEGQEVVEVLDTEPDDPDVGGLEVIMEDAVEIDGDGDENADPDLPPDLAHFTFSGHTDSVYCAAIHPTRIGVVITGGGDDTAYIWNYKSIASSDSNQMDIEDSSASSNDYTSMMIRLDGHTDTVTCVGFNFNGTLALTGGYDGIIRIWKVDTGELVQTLEGPEDVEWAQWHVKGNAVIAGSRDGTVWMWLTHNGQCVHVFAGHDGAVACGGFTKDGKMIYTGGEDGTIRQWMPKTGNCRHVYDEGAGHEAEVTCMASGGDGDLLLSGSADGTVKLYQLSGKKLLQTFIHSRRDSSSSSNRTGDNNHQDVSAEESYAQTQDDDGEPVFVMDEGSMLGVECVGFPNEEFKWVASGGMDKTLKVWDTVSGGLRSTCFHGGSVVSLKWHSTMPVICTAALDNSVRLWDARNGALLKEFTGHRDLVTSIDLMSIGRGVEATVLLPGATDVIVSVSDDNTAKVFLFDIHNL